MLAGYAGAMLGIGLILEGSNLTIGRVALFLAPSLAVGALGAHWKLLALPILLASIIAVYDYAVVCVRDCGGELLSDVPLLLVFVVPSVVAMVVGILLGKGVRRLRQRRPA